MQTIGFIDLGTMGGNIAARYLAAGYTVYGTRGLDSRALHDECGRR
jgi:3-hydroxyisobutyrate dehydrogenase-like beta-hydroxyacid dehydrogenase